MRSNTLVKWQKSLLDNKSLSENEFLFLYTLSTFMNNNGMCKVPLDELSSCSGLSVWILRKAVKSSIDKGLITVTRFHFTPKKTRLKIYVNEYRACNFGVTDVFN